MVKEVKEEKKEFKEPKEKREEEKKDVRVKRDPTPSRKEEPAREVEKRKERCLDDEEVGPAVSSLIDIMYLFQVKAHAYPLLNTGRNTKRNHSSEICQCLLKVELGQ